MMTTSHYLIIDDIPAVLTTFNYLKKRTRNTGFEGVKITCRLFRFYRITENCMKLELLHETVVDEIPLAICSYQGRVLVGVGRMLRLYDMGKKKLLRKCENKHIPNAIVSINAVGHRIYVSDVQESVYAVRYKRQENQLIVFADDTHPRWITTTCVLDYDTVATADKFGNIAVVSYFQFKVVTRREVDM